MSTTCRLAAFSFSPAKARRVKPQGQRCGGISSSWATWKLAIRPLLDVAIAGEARQQGPLRFVGTENLNQLAPGHAPGDIVRGRIANDMGLNRRQVFRQIFDHGPGHLAESAVVAENEWQPVVALFA